MKNLIIRSILIASTLIPSQVAAQEFIDMSGFEQIGKGTISTNQIQAKTKHKENAAACASWQNSQDYQVFSLMRQSEVSYNLYNVSTKYNQLFNGCKNGNLSQATTLKYISEFNALTQNAWQAIHGINY